MIIPYVVSYSLMFGAILSNGIMWPLISKQEGNWYPAGESAQSFQGLFGYKVTSCLLQRIIHNFSKASDTHHVVPPTSKISSEPGMLRAGGHWQSIGTAPAGNEDGCNDTL